MTRCSLLTLITAAASVAPTALAFNPSHRPQPPSGGTSQSSRVAYRTTTDDDIDTASAASSTAVPLTVDTPFLWEENNNINGKKNGQQEEEESSSQTPSTPLQHIAQRLEEDKDPALVEFLPAEVFHADVSSPYPVADRSDECLSDESMCDDDHYPIAAMLQGSAPYIASHLGETMVFYIPGEWLHKPNQLFDSFLQDVALSRLMGMKMVLVADCRMDEVDPQYCSAINGDEDGEGFAYAHECHNALRPTPGHTIRHIEEEAGFIRFEVERKMNRFLKKSLIGSSDEEGNVLGGNFYLGRKFGMVHGEDFEHTGFCSKVYADNIQQALARNDVVLLTTVGSSKDGDSVNVNGHHLAATVAASLKAYKLIYMSNQGAVLSQKSSGSNSKNQEVNPRKKFYQEIPLSFAKSLTDYYKVKAHKTGFANFEYARQTLEPRAVELLLNLAWSSWALEQGVSRAHVVNPKDGALLEELFTSKNGANTCLYHDDENLQEDDDFDWMSEDDADDWNAFFAEAAAQEQQVANTGSSN